jgi:hypothetical protein
MLGRDNVRAIVTEVIVKLNAYLNLYPHEVVTEEKAGGYPYSIRCNDGNYIVLKSDIPCHKTLLTLERMQNIYNTSQSLNNQLIYLKDDEKTLHQQLSIMRDFLEDAKTRNIQLSNKHGVRHTSYNDGLLARHGKFRSLMNTTLTRSGATRHVKESLSLLDEFKSKFPSAPPEYSTPVRR